VDRFPPRDYVRWHELVRRLVEHCVERFGREAVGRWFWDVWNEPDLRFYWLSSYEDFFKTYDHAAAAVKEVLPEAKVGGCGPADSMHPLFVEFLEHCMRGRSGGGRGAPLDFITFHVKGGPTGKIGVFTDPWQARDYEIRTPSLAGIMEKTRKTLELIASVPGTKGLPVYLTECDIDWGTGTSIYHNPNMHYRNSQYFPAFECALTKRMMDLRADFPDNPIEATFLDTFYFPGFRLFEGQRTLVTAERIDKPILNGLRLLAMLGGERLEVEGPDSPPPEILASSDEPSSYHVMAVNFTESFDYDQRQQVSVSLQGLSRGDWRVRHYRIDGNHSNAYTIWLDMGRPLVPEPEQWNRLEARMGLETVEPDALAEVGQGPFSLETELPPHSVSLWSLTRNS
jgi:xylan 1,4-beta-xylosidase